MRMRIACRVALVVAVGALLVSCTATVQEDESIGSEEASGTTARQQLIEVWEDHMAGEFATKSVEDTMATMIEGAHINHIPTMTGGTGLDAIAAFYGTHFIPRIPPDTETVLVSRTVGDNQIVDEMIFKFTHTIEMDFMLPGIEPTGKPVEVPLVAIIGFREGKVSHEHIYWDQASVLAQIGLLDADTLPIAGAETAHKVLDPDLPSNTLIERVAER